MPGKLAGCVKRGKEERRTSQFAGVGDWSAVLWDFDGEVWGPQAGEWGAGAFVYQLPTYHRLDVFWGLSSTSRTDSRHGARLGAGEDVRQILPGVSCQKSPVHRPCQGEMDGSSITSDEPSSSSLWVSGYSDFVFFSLDLFLLEDLVSYPRVVLKPNLIFQPEEGSTHLPELLYHQLACLLSGLSALALHLTLEDLFLSCSLGHRFKHIYMEKQLYFI